MASFRKVAAVAALETSLRAADHLGPKHAAVVAAARQLARRVDELDELGWVIDGKLDNVALPTYLRYMDALGLTVPPPAKASAVARKSAPVEAAATAVPAAGGRPSLAMIRGAVKSG